MFLLSVLLFLPQYIDVDFWWHLRLGNEISNGNWLNNLTYTCSNYPWVNHSWLSDYLYNLISNYTMIAFLNALVIATGVYFLYKSVLVVTGRQKNYLIYLLTIISSLLIIFRYLSVRPHLISFTFTAIVSYLLLRIIYQRKVNWKFYTLFSIIFLLWTNLHGGFIVGLAIIGFFVFLSFVQFALYSKKINATDNLYKNDFITLLKLLILSIFATLINPFGLDLWQEVFRNILINQGDYISEWKPFIFNSLNDYILLSFLTLLFLLHTKSQRKYWYITSLFTISFILTLLSGRYLLFSNIFIIILFIALLTDKLPTIKLNPKEFRKVAIITIVFYLSILVSIIGSFNSTRSNFNNLQESEKTPINAINYLKADLVDFEGKFYNDYELGGYLEYQLPEIKWFADGRMAVWYCESEFDNNKLFMNDVLEIYFGRDNWNETLNKYEINYIFTKSNSRLAQLLRLVGNWEIKYEDKFVIIFMLNYEN